MVTMYSNGITIQVNESDVDWYKRAGYSVVGDSPVESVDAQKSPPLKSKKKSEAEPARDPEG